MVATRRARIRPHSIHAWICSYTCHDAEPKCIGVGFEGFYSLEDIITLGQVNQIRRDDQHNETHVHRGNQLDSMEISNIEQEFPRMGFTINMQHSKDLEKSNDTK